MDDFSGVFQFVIERAWYGLLVAIVVHYAMWASKGGNLTDLMSGK